MPRSIPAQPQVVFRVVGGPARNVAITRFDFRQELASEDRFQVLMTVHNYTDAPVAVPASVSLDGRVRCSRVPSSSRRMASTLSFFRSLAVRSDRRSRASRLTTTWRPTTRPLRQ